MAIPDSMTVALKEWAALCDALATGRQMLLLRKGGIYEEAGEFRVEHDRFLLFPTYLHQKPEMVKLGDRGSLQPRDAEPDQITLSLAAEVTDIVQLHSRAQIDAIDTEHIWLPPLVDMRFNYRPENPLYLMLVRTYRLPRPTTIQYTPAYAGCKSWVPLDHPVDARNAKPVMDDADYQSRRSLLLAALR